MNITATFTIIIVALLSSSFSVQSFALGKCLSKMNHPTTGIDRTIHPRRSTLLAKSSNENDDSENDKDEKQQSDEQEQPPSLDEFLAEQEASRKVAQRLMFPRVVATSISQTITAFAWGFIILSFILQSLGYAFIFDDAGVRVDTLEAKQFQLEIIKSVKDGKDD